jgi:putative flippase GtrA
MPPLPAQVLAVVVVAVLSYLGHRFISFRTAG